jgi:hypothetical protein
VIDYASLALTTTGESTNQKLFKNCKERNMFKKTAIIAGIGLAITSTAQAQQVEEAVVTGNKLIDTYRWEINAGYAAGEYSGDFPDTDFDAFDISGSYYLNNVDTTKGPRSEAAFLDHASDVSLEYTYAEIDDNGIDVDGDTYGISGRYVTNQAGWIFAAGYERSEPVNAEIDTGTLSVGKYITDNTSLIVSYAKADADKGGDTDIFSLGLEHFWALGSNDGGIKLEGNAGTGDDIDIYNLTGTWYVNQSLGFGASYGKFDAGIDESDRYGIHTEWFITRHIAANLSYVHEELDKADFETDEFRIGARVRF